MERDLKNIMEEKIGTVIITKKLNEELPELKIKKDQVRNILKYFNFENKISSIEFEKILNFYKTYSKSEIKNILTKNTSYKKYGVENPSQSVFVKEKLKDNFFKKNEKEKNSIKEKRANTNKEIFGYEFPNQRPEAIEKAKKNWKNNIELGKKTCEEKFGENNFSKTEAFKEIMKEYSKSSKFKEVKEKLKKVWDKKTQEEKEIIKNYQKETHLYNLKKEKETIENNFKERILSIKEAADILQRDYATLCSFLKEKNFKILKGSYRSYITEKDFELVKENYQNRKLKGISSKEIEVFNFLKSFYKGEISRNVKGLIGKKELDIYIPEKRLAIEFDGLLWHSDLNLKDYKSVPDEETKNIFKWKQFEKTKLCEEKGIRLIHIFEDDWDFKNKIVKDILSQVLGFSKQKIYARKCIIKRIENNLYKEFLNENHLQGYSAADLRLGLFYENELVECIGIKTSGNHSKEPELVRLCSKIGINVLGGFSKLLKHSNQKYIVSYIDRATFSGNGYKKVGFTFEKENPPTYFYIKPGVIERYPRYKYMRKHIEEKFKKGQLEYFNPKETEEINMYKNGFGRIWNCGTIKVGFILNNSNTKDV